MKIDYKKGFIITFIALILLGGLNIYGILATVGEPFKVPKPDIREFEAEEQVIFVSMEFTYDDPLFTKVTGCLVSIKSIDEEVHSGIISVWFSGVMEDSVEFTDVDSIAVSWPIDFDPDILLANAISGKVVIQVDSP